MLGSKSRLVVLDTCAACSGFLRFERERKEKRVDGLCVAVSGSTEGFIQTCGMRKWFVVLCERENI